MLDVLVRVIKFLWSDVIEVKHIAYLQLIVTHASFAVIIWLLLTPFSFKLSNESYGPLKRRLFVAYTFH